MKKKYLILTLSFLPMIAFAQSSTVDDLISYVMSILKTLSTFMAPLAMLFFFWQLIKFIKASKDGSTDLAKNKDMMIYSGIILFVLVGIWTIVGYVQKSVGTDITTSNIDRTPTLPTELP